MCKRRPPMTLSPLSEPQNFGKFEITKRPGSDHPHFCSPFGPNKSRIFFAFPRTITKSIFKLTYQQVRVVAIEVRSHVGMSRHTHVNLASPQSHLVLLLPLHSSVAKPNLDLLLRHAPVSYTHLTLPTIYSV